MTDPRAGVHENGRVGPGAPRNRLTCPACGLHEHAERSSHPAFAFLCGACWTLFNATDEEWHRMRKHRTDAIERRNNPPVPLPAMRSHKIDRVEPITERVKEHDDQ